ncbi:binding-protein-dependent transport systems inner membrane component [Methanocorpusculum labreanum Z]|uniref:Binding-protein-dependent transport systems inner membrane component n=1 Tax=Methanocorpusculum labreanum (strain ATCC 43576 / DSM 4855 / Z) TaxID=410358 RepID=A2SQE7_METLZ|nr:ABC transporter permease [Methanocorpusculum labreanum]ABN06553.1 binding-protein-dependent transport systems inner membrane component [Methanocorpusculum labreanum Z]
MKWYIKLILPALVLVVWEVAAILMNNAYILPRVETVLAVFATPFADLYGCGSLVENSWVSIYRVTLGFIIACVIAVPLGIILGRYPVLEQFSDSLIQILRPIPPMAWVPLSLAWFGLGLTPILFIIVIGCIFPILVNTIDGVKRVKRSWVETAKIYQANERQIITKVIIPAAGPAIWNGLRVGFGIAWMSVVAAEMMPGTVSGLGYLIMYTYNWGQVQMVIAGMIAIGIIGIAMDQFFQYVMRTKFAWEVLDK